MEVSGPPGDLAAFRQAAAGAGTVPWRLDLDRMEEDWFHRLAAAGSRTISIEGARVLAGQLREAVERRHSIAVARVGRSTACAFDLHSLAPIPEEVLRLGPEDPASAEWLWSNWGTGEALRHVIEVDGAKQGGEAAADSPPAWRLTFWSADWTPWPALAHVRFGWPSLRIEVRPTYGGR